MSSSRIPLFALFLLLAACGSNSSTETGSQGLDEGSRTFLSVSVLENDEPRALVDGTRIQLSFNEGQIGVSAGCNSMSGSFTVSDDGVLQVSDMAMTEMGCDGPRHAQDEFVSRFLSANPLAQIDGDSLTLSTGTVQIEFLDIDAAIPDAALFDTQWTFDTFFDQSVARSVFVDEPGWLQFADGSTAIGFDGCVKFDLAVEIEDGSDELQFGSRSDTTTATCDNDTLSYAALIDAALRGTATYEISGETLTITASNGDGVILRSDG